MVAQVWAGVLVAAPLATWPGGAAAAADHPPYAAAAANLFASPAMKAAEAQLAKDYDRTVADVVTLTEIPAPPFKEAARAKAYLEMLKAHGLSSVEMDEAGNVMGLRKGAGDGPLVVVAAHLDTVFPEGVDVKVRRSGNVLAAPGVSDDSCSLAVLLAYVRALDAAGVRTKGDILFVGDVGEEGPGDLRGLRHLYGKGKYADRIGYFISIEPGAGGGITTAGVGSKRYQVTFRGPGGHSLFDFGIVNPAYAMADAIEAFSRIRPKAGHSTVYNVGLIEGGASVNTIPASVSMTVDMRSERPEDLKALEDRFLAIVREAGAKENKARSVAKGPITIEINKIGDRPAGRIGEDQPIIQAAAAAIAARGDKPSYRPGSSDANVPLSLGRPATVLDAGFAYQDAHSLQEQIELNPEHDVKVMAQGLATVLLLAGVAEP